MNKYNDTVAPQIEKLIDSGHIYIDDSPKLVYRLRFNHPIKNKIYKGNMIQFTIRTYIAQKLKDKSIKELDTDLFEEHITKYLNKPIFNSGWNILDYQYLKDRKDDYESKE